MSLVLRFKGLECDTVRLLDDFLIKDDVPEPPTAELREEFNLLYVALTRARTRLIINDAVFFMLSRQRVCENFERLVPREQIKEEICVR